MTAANDVALMFCLLSRRQTESLLCLPAFIQHDEASLLSRQLPGSYNGASHMGRDSTPPRLAPATFSKDPLCLLHWAVHAHIHHFLGSVDASQKCALHRRSFLYGERHDGGRSQHRQFVDSERLSTSDLVLPDYNGFHGRVFSMLIYY